MLGRLVRIDRYYLTYFRSFLTCRINQEMDVQSCIKAYKDLSSTVFTPRKRVAFGGSLLHKLVGAAPFSAEKLESEIRKVVEDNEPLEDGGTKIPKGKENTRDVPLLVNPAQRCKV